MKFTWNCKVPTTIRITQKKNNYVPEFFYHYKVTVIKIG